MIHKLLTNTICESCTEGTQKQWRIQKMTLEEKIYEISEFDTALTFPKKLMNVFSFLWYLTPVALTRH